jgi:3-hydroxyisobutyrate dehydrogenase-like beta-hydroxyacid dehydrogenase
VAEPHAPCPGRRRHALSAVNIFVKDLGIVLDQARGLPSRCRWPRPRTSCSSPAAANGQGQRDNSFVIRVWEALAGIKLPEKAEP